jgi:predicted nucleotidyltransferase
MGGTKQQKTDILGSQIMISRDQAVQIALTAIQKNFPHATCACLFGSAIRDDLQVGSDIDVLVIVQNEYQFTRFIALEGRIQVDMAIYTAEKLKAALESARAYGKINLIAAATEGAILFDRLGIGEELRALAMEILKIGPGKPSRSELNMFRLGLEKTILQIDSIDNGEKYSVAIALFAGLQRTLSRINGGWRGEGKWGRRHLQEVSPEIAAELDTIIREFFVHGGTRHLKAFCSEVLELLGGPFEGGPVDVEPL